MRPLFLPLVTLVGIRSIAAATELTAETFDELVFGGKTSSFIKFFAPWCGHCKALAPTWEALGDEYAGSDDILIGKVDCTSSDGQALCERVGVQAFPTLKFVQKGDDQMQEYDGEDNEFLTLSAFAKERVRPACTASNQEACTEEELTELHGYLALSPKEREETLKVVRQPLKEAQERLAKLEERVEALEEKVEEQEDIVETLQNLHGPRIRLLRSTLRGTELEDQVPTQAVPEGGATSDSAEVDKDEI